MQPCWTKHDEAMLHGPQVLRVSAVGIGVVYGSWKLSSLKVTAETDSCLRMRMRAAQYAAPNPYTLPRQARGMP